MTSYPNILLPLPTELILLSPSLPPISLPPVLLHSLLGCTLPYRWAAKNLLNDIDLMVISPSGAVFHGNNRQGDEFNPVERVVIRKPEHGLYTIHVTTKRLAIGEEQAYSIVITSNGYVDEAATSVVPVTTEEITRDDATRACDAKGGYLVRMQVEDWNAGDSWRSIFFTVSERTTVSGSPGKSVFIRTFVSNHDRKDAATNRIEQFSVCLQPDVRYIASIDVISEGDDDRAEAMKFIRVSAPDCYMYLSAYWRQSPIFISNDVCNACPAGSGLVDVVMLANVTDDDYIDYSW
jgi:hypothetical protein